MNKEQHQQEIAEIKKHVRMLKITGGISIGALALAGFLMVVDIVRDNPGEQVMAEANTITLDETITRPANLNILPGIEPGSDANADDPKNFNGSEKFQKGTVSKKNNLAEELQSFRATCSDGSIFFHWVLTGGSKYNHEVEQSIDQEHFEVFTRAPQPEKKDGLYIFQVEETADFDEVYFRLRRVVGKGKYEYSEAIKVNCSGDAGQMASVDVYPNGNGAFRIIINAPVADSFKVTLADMNGMELVTEEYLAQKGANEFILNSNNISRGNYTLKVSNDTLVKEKKVVLK